MTEQTKQPNSFEARDSASVVHPLTNLKEHLEKGPVIINEGKEFGLLTYTERNI